MAYSRVDGNGIVVDVDRARCVDVGFGTAIHYRRIGMDSRGFTAHFAKNSECASSRSSRVPEPLVLEVPILVNASDLLLFPLPQVSIAANESDLLLRP